MIAFFAFLNISAGLIWVYLSLARKKGIVDQPNHRSSHTQATVRGAGFVIPVLPLVLLLYHGYYATAIGLFLIAIISLLDDIKPLPALLRLPVQALGVALMVSSFGWPWAITIGMFVFVLGWVNIYNFMDGINGIMALNGLVTIGTLLLLDFPSSDYRVILSAMFASLVVFSFLNVRNRALAFSGDVGSVGLAFLIAWLLLSYVQSSGDWSAFLLISVFALDGGLTILRRLWKGENVLQAHRSHVYQWLANEWGWKHLQVSTLYAGVQMTINLIWLFAHEAYRPMLAMAICGLLAMVFLIARFKLKTKVTQ
jgi:UDP-N-acetylmuramyl pentapeptide phosphotransferase/UDP-N-acetylglucosamine-1-phosphate transferase